jgi:hypothetical protein
MANKLNNGFKSAQTVASILTAKGRTLVSGYMDEFDMEAERAANSINRIRGLAPQKSKRSSGFGKASNHPNADRYNVAMIGD